MPEIRFYNPEPNWLNMEGGGIVLLCIKHFGTNAL